MSFSFVAIKKVTKIVLQCFKPLSPFFFFTVSVKKEKISGQETEVRIENTFLQPTPPSIYDET